MSSRPATFHFYSFFPVILISLFLFYASACADEQPQFHTIQAGSYAGEQGALLLYQDIADTLPEPQRSYLRIEKIGNYFTVRVGKFSSWDEAAGFLAQTEQYLPNGMILQAYIKEERILRMYQPVADTILALETEQAAVFAEEEVSNPVERSSDESAVIADVVVVGSDMQVEEAAPPAPVSEQKDSGVDVGANMQTAVIDEVQQIAETGEVLQSEKLIGQIPAVEEETADVIVTDTAQPQQENTSGGPAEAGASAWDWGTRETEIDIAESDITEWQQGLAPGDDESAREQPETVSEETGVEDATADDKRRFDRLGQPAGFYPVRMVAILNKDIFGGEYRYPTSVYYDPIMDEIFVIGGGGVHPSTRIMIYGPDYYPVASLGEGRGVISPSGVALDAEGNLFIAHRGGFGKGPSLMVLNPAFFQMAEVFFSDFKEVPDDFSPRAVAVDERHIYLVGEFSNGVLVLDRNYNFVRWLVPLKVGSRKEQIGDDLTHKDTQRAFDVVVDGKGRVYILCPEAGRIYVLDAEWNFLFAFGAKGGSSGKLSRPRSLAVDAEREAIYVVDYMRHTVNIYDYSSGKFLFEVGGMGESPGWFKYPTHVEVDGRGNLIVADMFNHRVQVLLVP